eukprot:CAMPEP_0113599710 /NCGR_PEP_ID=MMETSP0015_2-20120614/42301_1 /TAXON_ID=2838 /ORGANISM="Odontella" /LENGTH=83 /DNA_ID=CAMNT_0000507883 /DNA_START=80 /DNA_END=330 /DNA_ORIENTATION=- /assembly_acc=CAM_ASM_000160
MSQTFERIPSGHIACSDVKFLLWGKTAAAPHILNEFGPAVCGARFRALEFITEDPNSARRASCADADFELAAKISDDGTVPVR